MGREPRYPLEQPDQLKDVQVRRHREVVQAQIIETVRPQGCGNLAEPGAIVRTGVNRPDRRATTLEHGRERQQQAFPDLRDAPDIGATAPLFESVVQRAESCNETRVLDGAAPEGRHILEAQTGAYLVEGFLAEVKGAVDPALAATHTGRLDFSGIEHEERVRASFRLEPTARNDRTARVRNGNHHFGVDVRPVLVIRKVGMEEAQPRKVSIPPIAGGISSLRTSHAAAILANTLRQAPAMIAAPATEATMIVRIWRGWAANSAAADLYAEFLRSTFLPSIHSIPGYHGASVLRRTVADGWVEFTTLTRFESLEAIRAFAGDDCEAAHVAPRARELLSRFDARCQHFEWVIEDRPSDV